MKHTYIAVILLAAVIAAVCVNGFFVRKTVSEFEEYIKSLPESEKDFLLYPFDTKELTEKWYSYHAFLSFSLHMYELERACDAVSDMCAAAEISDYAGYYISRSRLLAVLRELADGERINAASVF